MRFRPTNRGTRALQCENLAARFTACDAKVMKWEELFRQKINTDNSDPAHDILHVERVVNTAKSLAEKEGADLDVVIPAAWLHDFVVIPKNDPRRSQASRISAQAAVAYLREIGYPQEHHAAIAHAIESHSFSAAINPRTLEARVVQDADRLDGLGAIGLARLFITAGLMRRPIYSENDPFCREREPNDAEFTVDHIFRKLFVVADSLQTESGRAEGAQRRAILERYVSDLSREVFVGKT